MRKLLHTFSLLLILTGILQAQQSEYYIGSIGVLGTNHVDRSQIIKISGLDKQKKINGEGISRAIKDLWASEWFSDVKVYALEPKNESIDLVIQVEENPRMAKFFLNGTEEISEDQIRETFEVYNKMILAPYKMAKIKEKIVDLYITEGFLQTKVSSYTII
jgi:outer membrane protein insertion porin family